MPSPSSPTNYSQNRFIPLTPYPPTPTTSPITRPTYSVLAKLQGLPPSPNPYNRSPSTASSSSNKTEFHINPNIQVIKILESIEEQKLNQGTNSVSKLSKSNKELAQKIKDCDDDEEFARLMNHIRNSPTPSEDLFQDSQDPYDSIELL
ncbi:hypothetical protein Tco_1340449 [Tanacetum coccineum]